MSRILLLFGVLIGLPCLAADEQLVPVSKMLDAAGLHPCGMVPWFPQEDAEGPPINVRIALAPIESKQDAQEPAEVRFARVLTELFVGRYGASGLEPDRAVHRVNISATSGDTRAILPAMRAGQVQMSWSGPIPFAQLFHEVNALPVLTASRYGALHYFSGLLVQKERAEKAGIKSLCDLKGKTIAWVSPTSGSGYLIPRMMMRAQQCDGVTINPETFFSQQIMAGSPAAVVKAVAAGQVDVGATWADPPEKGTGAWNRYFGGIYGKQIKAIWHSDPIPNDTVAVSQTFRLRHPRVAMQMACVLAELHNDEAGLDFMLSAFGISRMVPAINRLYEPMALAWCAEHGGKRCAELRRKTGIAAPSSVSRAHASARWQEPERVYGAVVVFILIIVLVVLMRLRGGRLPQLLLGLLLLLVVLWSAYWNDFLPQPIFDGLTSDQTGRADGTPNGRGDFLDQLISMANLDLSVAAPVIEATIETLQTAIVATFVALLISLPLGFAAAKNVNSNSTLRHFVRFGLNADRAVDTLIVAIIFVGAFGLGPLAGTMALALHSVGMLAKLFYEAVEEIDGGPVEALQSVGASHLAVIRWAMFPQVLPYFVSYTLYRLELNVRGAVVLGLVGGGGIGRLLMEYAGIADWGKVATVIVVIMVLVMGLDALSSRLRAILAGD
jgi:phosphonate transport system permease protein